MNNHWLNSAKKKQVFKEIDQIANDVSGAGGTFGDFLAQLNDEQSDFLMNMLIKDFASDSDDFELGFSTIVA